MTTSSTAKMTSATKPVVEQAETEEVFELLQSRPISAKEVGLFRSLDGAKAEATRLHKHYQELLESFTPEIREETEGVVDELVWTVEQAYFGSSQQLPSGPPRPVCRYGTEGSFFEIRTRTLNP